MLIEKFNLSKYISALDGADVVAYLFENKEEIDIDRKYPTILLCPGGGYAFTSAREAEPIAMVYLSKGYQVFVLDYSTSGKNNNHYPTQLLEVCGLMHVIRQNATKWNVAKDKIAVMGFSAGGHLASMCSTLYNAPIVKAKIGDDCRPDASILCYPVISGDMNISHSGSFENLTGSKNANDYLKVSSELNVTRDTPKAFIWHCSDDTCVPVFNSLRYATALKENGVDFEMHIFPSGGHGGSLHNMVTTCKKWEKELLVDYNTWWIDQSVEWLKKIGLTITF